MKRLADGPFDIKTHKKTFINRLEVVILEDGTVEYAVPSHQMKLIELACKKLSVTKDELSELCPEEYGHHFNKWLSKVSGILLVWESFYEGTPNEAQLAKLKELQGAGFYIGKL